VRAMETLRKLAPLVLALCGLAAGLACIAYGYALHTATVLVEGAPPAEPAPPPDEPSPPAKQPAELGEWDLVRDATVGGIKRTADGRLERTYSGGPAEACPT